jgi:Uma2 family endonuclease
MVGVTLLDGSWRERDHRVTLRGTWEGYELVLALKGDHSAPRIAYLDGEIEIMSPGPNHEHYGANIARMVEEYCLRYGIEVAPFGSWTQKRERKQAGVEPDECYVLGGKRKPRPDLAIEVVWTSGGIDKLEIYRRLAIREVWFWERGKLSVFVLHGGKYRQRTRSHFLPGLDLALVCRLAPTETINELRRRFVRALRG